MISEIKKSEYDIIEKMFPAPFKNSKVEEQLNNNEFRKIYVLSIEEKIIGFICIDQIYERMELIDINIEENSQGRGYSNILMDHMIEIAKEKNVVSITLEVNITNKVAINLYKKYGFEEISVRKKYYNGIDGILMEKKMID